MSSHTRIYPYQRQTGNTITATGLSIDLLFLMAVFFLSRATLLAELYPFGSSIIIAIGSRRQRILWPVVLAVMLSTWFTNPNSVYSRLLVFLILGLAYTFYPSWRQRSSLIQATLVPMAIILIRGIDLTLGQPSFYSWVEIVFESIMSWGLSLAFLEVSDSKRQEERLLGSGLFFLGVLLGLQGFKIAGFSLQGLVSRYILLLASLTGGPGIGAAVGTALGFIPSLSQMATPSLAGLMAFSGLIAGSLKSLGKPGVIGGYLLSHLVLANYFLGPNNVLLVLKESVIVVLSLLITPPSLTNYLSEFLSQTTKQQLETTDSSKQEKLSEVLKSLARHLKYSGYNESPQTVIRQVARIVCNGCPAAKVCWQLEGEQMLTTLQELLNSSQGKLTSNDIPEWLSSRCTRCRELLAALTTQANKFKVQSVEDGLNSWLANTFEILGSMVTQESSRVEQNKDNRKKPSLKVSVGIAAVPRHQADITGDAFSIAPIAPDKHLLVLGDGMGVGRKAANESGTAIEMLQDLLDAGFSPEFALRTVNMILLLRSSQESYTTLDIALLNCFTGTAYFYKLGACPSFIHRNGSINILRSHSLPVGILEDLQLEPLREELQDGDLLVMVSDGILEAHRDINEKEKWLAKALQRVGEARPQEIADRLLKQASALVSGKPLDDMTVVVARVEKVG